jgi:hypothetical protein
MDFSQVGALVASVGLAVTALVHVFMRTRRRRKELYTEWEETGEILVEDESGHQFIVTQDKILTLDTVAVKKVFVIGRERTGRVRQVQIMQTPHHPTRRDPKRREGRWTRRWELAGFLFDRKTRAKVYEPVINELREDFLLARRDCTSAASRRWVKTCFVVRGTLAFLRCVRISVFRPVLALIPSKLKQLWKLFG